MSHRRLRVSEDLLLSRAKVSAVKVPAPLFGSPPTPKLKRSNSKGQSRKRPIGSAGQPKLSPATNTRRTPMSLGSFAQFSLNAKCGAEKNSKSPRKAKRSLSTKKRVTSKHRRSMPSLTNKLNHVNYVSRCAYKTRVGSVLGKPKKNNQDAFVVHPYVGNLKSQYLFGVFDGHGQVGHEVSSFIKSTVTRHVENCLAELHSDEPDLLGHALKKGIATTDLLLSHTLFFLTNQRNS